MNINVFKRPNSISGSYIVLMKKRVRAIAGGPNSLGACALISVVYFYLIVFIELKLVFHKINVWHRANLYEYALCRNFRSLFGILVFVNHLRYELVSLYLNRQDIFEGFHFGV